MTSLLTATLAVSSFSTFSASAVVEELKAKVGYNDKIDIQIQNEKHTLLQS